jgi:hypothetical protein
MQGGLEGAQSVASNTCGSRRNSAAIQCVVSQTSAAADDESLTEPAVKRPSLWHVQM